MADTRLELAAKPGGSTDIGGVVPASKAGEYTIRI